MMPELTCRTMHAGSRYYHKRRGAVVTVGRKHVHLVCEKCEYMVNLSLRVYGLDGVEEIRRNHLNVAHFTDITHGVVRVTEEPLRIL